MNDYKGPYKLFPPEKAEELAADLNNQRDGWDYKPAHDPKGTGRSFIEIWDGQEFVGRI